MSFVDLQKKIKSKKFSPFYLLYGTENYLISEIVNLLTTYALAADEKSFNLSSYDMEEQSIDLALEDAETLPFFGERRVVLIKNCTFLATTKDKQEHDLKKLEQFLTNPVPYSIIVFIAPYEKLDERKKIVKLLKKQAEKLDAKKIDNKSVESFILSIAQQEDVSISKHAIDKLSQQIGNNLDLLTNELRKMALHVGTGEEITETVVDELVARTLENDIFSLVDHVVHNRMEAAYRIYYDLLKQNEEPIKILALIARQFRMILQTKLLLSKGYSERQIVGMIKTHPYAIKVAWRQSKLFSEGALKIIMNEIAEADYMMKTGKMDKSLIMELFFTKIEKEQ